MILVQNVDSLTLRQINMEHDYCNLVYQLIFFFLFIKLSKLTTILAASHHFIIHNFFVDKLVLKVSQCKFQVCHLNENTYSTLDLTKTEQVSKSQSGCTTYITTLCHTSTIELEYVLGLSPTYLPKFCLPTQQQYFFQPLIIYLEKQSYSILQFKF